MDFSNIRLGNIFGGDGVSGGRRRPFGMPEIDEETAGQMLSDIIPRAEAFNRQKQIRDQEQMKFEFNLKNPKPVLSMTDKAYGATAPGNATPMAGTVAGPSGGSQGNFSPMQRMFQERDALEKRQKFVDEQAKQEQQSKYRQAIDERNLQESGALKRTGMEVGGRLENTRLEGDMRSQLERDKAGYDTEAAKTKHGYTLSEQEAQEQARAKGDIAVNRSRPPNAAEVVTGKEGLDNINLNARRFVIEHPDMAGALKFDPVTGDVTGIDSSRVDPQQLRFIQQSLTGGRPGLNTQRPPAPAPNSSSPGRGSLMGRSRTQGGK